MEKINYTKLSHLDVIHLQGQDALKFLQGQCTADVFQLKDKMPLLGAFCTAKGRAITNMWLIKGDEADSEYFMICEKGAAAALHKHLSKYIPFFRGTKMTYQPNAFQGLGFAGENALKEAKQVSENDAAAIYCAWGDNRAMAWLSTTNLSIESEKQDLLGLTQWQTQDIIERKLWLSSEQAEQWIPQNVSLDELGGISFKKGCYTGQEVIARLHYKGKSKKRLYPITWTSDATITQVNSDTGPIGDVIQHSFTDGHSYALAVLKEDKLTEPMFGDENQQLIVELLH